MINFRRDKAASSCKPLSRRAKNWAATDDLTARTCSQAWPGEDRPKWNTLETKMHFLLNTENAFEQMEAREHHTENIRTTDNHQIIMEREHSKGSQLTLIGRSRLLEIRAGA